MKGKRIITGSREYRSRIIALLLTLILALGQVQQVAAFAAEDAVAGGAGDEALVEIEEAVSYDAAADTDAAGGDDEAYSEEDIVTDERGGAATVSMNFKDGMAQPILDELSVSKDSADSPVYDNYKNRRNGSVQRFTVYVETDLDTDMDGKNDLVMALIQVPTAAVNGDYKAPVIFEASPYYGGETEDIPVEKFSKYHRPDKGEIFEWNDENPSISEDMLYKPGTKRTASGNISTIDHANRQDYTCEDWYFDYADYFNEPSGHLYAINSGFLSEYDYFLARGFAVVLSAGLGTRGSEGFETCGSVAEAKAFASVVEWIHGDRKAFTDKEHNIEIKASDWASGQTAMEGLSYDGTLAYAVAALNPAGLMTVVPESGIADWYDYTNTQGVCWYGNGVKAQYDYTTHLASTNSSRFFKLLIDMFINKVDVDKTSEDYKLYKLYEKVLSTFDLDQYALKGHYGPHWQGRDYYTAYKDGKIETPALIVAGLQDYNVINKHAQLMSEAFSVRRVLLHLGAHEKPENMTIAYWDGNQYRYRSYNEILNLWYSHFLCGQANGILEELPKVLAQDNTNGWFNDYPDWNKPGSENWGNKKLVIKPSDSLEHKLISVNSAKPVDDDEILDPHVDEELDKIRYYNIDDYYNELGMDYVSPLNTAADPAAAQGKLLIWAKHADSDMTINGAGEVHLRIKTDTVSDADCQQPVAGAMLYDVSNEYFNAYELNSDNKLDTVIIQTNAYDGGKAVGTDDQVEYMTSSVKKHFITKGYVNLLDPQSGYYPAESAPSTNKIKEDTYYDYTLYLNPTFYTVKEGHTLVLYLYPKGGGVDSNSDFTVDNANSFAYIPLNKEITQAGVSINSIYTEDDYGSTCLSENLILPAGNEKVSTVTTEGVTMYSKTDRSIWVRVDDVYLQDGRMAWIYQGDALTLNPGTIHVYDGTKVLSLGQDYTIAYKNNKKASDNAELIIKFKGSYKGNKQISYPMTIVKAALDNKAEVSINSVVTAAAGKALKPVPEMFYPYTGISIPSSDVKITYSSKTDKSIDHAASVKAAGEYTINIEPKKANGNLKGSAAVDLTVLDSAEQGKLLSAAAVEFVDHSNKKYVYENKAIIPKLSVTLQGVNDGRPLTEGTHYTEKAYRNQEPGTARVVISAVSGNSLGIRGSRTLTFKITKGRELKDAEGSGFTFTVADAPYSASGAKGNVAVKDGETTLTAGTDYTVKYSKNKSVKEKAAATIRGKGKYKGTVTKEYAVLPMDLNRLEVTAADKFGNTENKDGYKNPVVTVKDLNGKKLKEKRDYTLGDPESDASDETKTQYKINIYGAGNYAGTSIATYRFMDKSANLAKVKAAKIPAQLITGDDVRIPWEVQEKLLYTGTSKNQTPLEFNKDYELYDYINNTKTGTAKVVYRGIGKYAGTKTVSFKITDGKKRSFLGWLMDNVLRKG